MSKPFEQIYNEYLSAHAELDAMAGYEETYPEHYEKVRAEFEAAKKAYDDAVARGQSLPDPEAALVCVEKTESSYDDQVCAPHPVAGDGDVVCFQERVVTESASGGEGDGAAEGTPQYRIENVAADEHTISEDTAKDFGIGKNDRTGYKHFRVSSRIAESLRSAAQEIRDAGCILTSSGATRPLNATVSAGRSATSFHYSGLAIDMYTLTATLDPTTDKYVVTREGETWKFRVYCRSTNTDTVDKVTLQAITFDDSKDKLMTTVEVEDHFVDLTAIMESHDFERIQARKDFRNNAAYKNRLSMEWWHYQHTSHLTVNTTTFGEVLQEIYSADDLADSPPWQHRELKFDGGGFS
jgi:hypothetical protein